MKIVKGLNVDDNELLKLVSDILEMQAVEVSFEDSLEVLGWDSLSSLELIAIADRKYGLKVAGNRLADAKTVGDLRKAIIA